MKLVPMAVMVLAMLLVPAFALAQNYSGVGACQGCHSNSSVGGTQYTQWSQTLHSQAYDSLGFVKNQTSCAPCHTTGWDTTKANKGADDYVTRNGDGTFTVTDSVNFYQKVNVQCEDCHGPVQFGVNHAYPPPPGSLQNPKAEVCGTCHSGSHDPFYDEWVTTKHSVSDTNSSAFLTNMFRADSNCSACHTYQGFRQFVGDTSLVPKVTPPDTAALSLVCAACHDPHSKAIDKQLRLPKAEICEKCHNPEYDPKQPTPGTEVHNTTAYMFEGKGGYEYQGYTYSSSAHTFVVTDKCVTCHMNSSPYVSPTQIAVTGHSFEPKAGACVKCHSDFDSLATTFDYRRVQTVTDSMALVLSNKLAAATPADSATDAFKRAKFNYDFVTGDPSHGIHNTSYAQGLLQSAIANFSPSMGVDDLKKGIPRTFALNQNYPNPFNPSTSIGFDLPSKQTVRIAVYDILGNLVTTLVNQDMPAGSYRVTWDGSDRNGLRVTSGMYLYRIDAGPFTQTRKMVVIK